MQAQNNQEMDPSLRFVSQEKKNIAPRSSHGGLMRVDDTIRSD
jgi:hypothetical protein